MSGETKDILLARLRDGEPLGRVQQFRLVGLLALPAILAQLSSVMMQYIDTAMVGRLGSGPAASIGLVSTTTWIMFGFVIAACTGFSVQIAHLCGAGDFKGARSVMRQGLVSALAFSSVLAAAGVLVSASLPLWLRGDEALAPQASVYFRIYSLFLPVGAIGYAATYFLQASGNMKVPSLLYVGMCVMDVIFNYLFIFVMDMGVAGAALGTGVSEAVTMLLALYFVLVKSKEMAITGEKGSFRPTWKVLKNALGITSPLWLQNIVMRGAYIMCTVIIAPLGAIAIAANTFAIAAESFCYMPGYGLEDASTTLVGQSIGARRKDMAVNFTWIAIALGAFIMGFLGILMYIFAPQLMGLLSEDAAVVSLGVKVLRIEAFAEALYAVSIIGYGACVGAGDTLLPTALNFGSMWLVRVVLASVLTPRMGLPGYWLAMCIELNVRGLLFLGYVARGKWMNKNFTN